MNILGKRGLAAASATALLSLGLSTGLGSAAWADDQAGSEPCASEQAKVDKAAAKLEALQAVFQKEKQQLRKAERALEKARGRSAEKKAKDAVEDAEDDVADAADDKKAQVMRLEKAQQRLDACLAGTGTEDPSDESGGESGGEPADGSAENGARRV
jgi:glucokinase